MDTGPLAIILVNLVGGGAVLALLLPAYVLGRRRLVASEEPLAHDPELLTGYRRVTGGPRPVLIFLAAVLGVIVVGLVIQYLVTTQIEPEAGTIAVGASVLVLVAAPVPVVLGIVLVAMLIWLIATTRSRYHYLEQIAHQPGAPEAAARLRNERGSLGIAGAAGFAAVTCLLLGIGWVGLLFAAAGGAIQCVRNPKCL
ncbi:hypothetical protein [Microlunatus sp. GCM10028923]|uniref:hypothetical protein n=1 Tax=Microlunatus sp. GCM10028923 TaxID=3273400 RepID=UPI003615313D